MFSYMTCLFGALALPAAAQTIDSRGLQAGGVRIDASGIHSGNAGVSRHGAASRPARGSTINGNGAVRDMNCRGGSLIVNGNRNVLTATECSSITLAGNRNRLRWHRDRGRTAISDIGNGNAVRRY